MDVRAQNVLIAQSVTLCQSVIECDRVMDATAGVLESRWERDRKLLHDKLNKCREALCACRWENVVERLLLSPAAQLKMNEDGADEATDDS